MSYNMLNPEINTATADIKTETDPYLLSALENITAHVLNDLQATRTPSLGSGIAGILLFLSYYNKLFPPTATEEAAMEAAEKAYVDYKKMQPGKMANYLSGAGGIVAVFENITKHGLLETDVKDVFRDVDGAVRKQLLHETMHSLSIQQPILGGGIYMCARLWGMDNVYTSNVIRNQESLIAAIDGIKAVFNTTSRTKALTSSYLNNLSSCLILLCKISATNIYPEVTEKLTNAILQFIEDRILPLSDKTWQGNTGIANISYACWQTGRQHDSNLLPRLLSILKAQLSPLKVPDLSFENIRQVQQLNRLYHGTGNSAFRLLAEKNISVLIDRYKTAPYACNPGLSGTSGLGLCILSYISNTCLDWDEVMSVS